MDVEAWVDAHGIVWELVTLDDSDCLIRQVMDRTDWLDGDTREGVTVVARFSDAEDARAYLAEEGFEPLQRR